MTYREKLELYKGGKLEEKLIEEVKADIERQEAISEYLYEQEEIPELAEMFGDVDGKKTDCIEMNQGEEDFTKMIQKSIRKAFRKMGAMVLAILLVILLLVETALPKMVDSFYYNPAKKIGEYTKQLDLDMAVYTELMIPQNYRVHTEVKERGYGEYDIVIPQTYTYTSTYQSIAGNIERNHLSLYNVNVLKPLGNVFGWFQAEEEMDLSLSDIMEQEKNNGMGGMLHASIGDRETATNALQSLDENEYYVGYVTLEEVLPYEEFVTFDQENQCFATWCAVVTGEQMGECVNPLGFFMAPPVSTATTWNQDQYPYLQRLHSDSASNGVAWCEEEYEKDITLMKNHFISLMKYYRDQTQFRKTFIPDSEETIDTFDNKIQYVEENGLNIYGFMVVANKEELLKLNEMPEVYEIVTEVLY